jgi:hypothetical protein
VAEELHDLQLKLRRSGWFDARRVDGWQYQGERGELAWHIRTWPESGDPIEDYWVEDGEFYEVVELHLDMNDLPMNRIETGRRITGIDTAKRIGILNAIAEWEKPLDPEAP